jgi:hypothetical protein
VFEVAVEDDEDVPAKSFVIIGCSHGSRLALALEDMGHEAKFINAAGWATNPDVVDTNSRLVREERELNEDVFFIFFLYDNDIYKVENEGELTDAIKQGNIYHINGNLKIVDRDGFREIFNISVPLLRAAGENPKLIVSLLVRYINAPCCSKMGHVANFGKEDFVIMLGEAMADIRAWLKDFTYGKKI